MVLFFRCSLVGTTYEKLLVSNGHDCSFLQLSENVSNYVKMPQTPKPALYCLIGFCGGATCNLMHRLHYNGLCSSQLDKPYVNILTPELQKAGGPLVHQSMDQLSILFVASVVHTH